MNQKIKTILYQWTNIIRRQYKEFTIIVSHNNYELQPGHALRLNLVWFPMFHIATDQSTLVEVYLKHVEKLDCLHI